MLVRHHRRAALEMTTGGDEKMTMTMATDAMSTATITNDSAMIEVRSRRGSSDSTTKITGDKAMQIDSEVVADMHRYRTQSRRLNSRQEAEEGGREKRWRMRTTTTTRMEAKSKVLYKAMNRVEAEGGR